MGAAALERKFNELSASHEQLVRPRVNSAALSTNQGFSGKAQH
jgi:hypothetical protein